MEPIIAKTESSSYSLQTIVESCTQKLKDLVFLIAKAVVNCFKCMFLTRNDSGTRNKPSSGDISVPMQNLCMSSIQAQPWDNVIIPDDDSSDVDCSSDGEGMGDITQINATDRSLGNGAPLSPFSSAPMSRTLNG